MRCTVKCYAHWCGAIERDNPSVKFFRFPHEGSQTYDAWASYVGNERLLERRCKQAWLCQRHFGKAAFEAGYNLVHNAVPSIPLPFTPEATELLNNEYNSAFKAEIEGSLCKKIDTTTLTSMSPIGSPHSSEFFSPSPIFTSPSTVANEISGVYPLNSLVETSCNVFTDQSISPSQRKRKYTVQTTSSLNPDELTSPKKRLYETVMKRMVR